MFSVHSDLQAIFDNVSRSTRFLEGKQAEQEATNRRIDNTLTQASTAISELNNVLLGQQKTLTEMSTAVNGLAAQLTKLTAQLQHVLSQKVDIPTSTDKVIG